MTPIFTVPCAETTPASRLSPRASRRNMFFIAASSRSGDRFFAPEPQRLLRRTIGIAEKHGVLARLVRDRAPGRHDENVVRLPREIIVAHPASTATFDDAVDGRVGRSIRHSAKARRKELDERADRWHRVSPRGRIHVLHLVAVSGVRWTAAADLLQRFAGACIV